MGRLLGSQGLTMLQQIQCIRGVHRPDRKRAWYDAVQMRAPCRGCGKGMVRDIHGWRPFREDDHNPERRPHPRFHQPG